MSLVEFLVDDLDADLAKRRIELADLRLLVSASTGARGTTLARSCHVMAYAHWEGFVKFALRTYLSHLVKLKIPIRDLKYGLQGLALRSQIKRAVGQSDLTTPDLASFLANFESLTTSTFVVNAGEVILTGNLTADRFRALMQCVDLDYLSTYETRTKYIDEVLCGRRHRVAHGEWQPIAADEARRTAIDVLDLCDRLNQQVQTAALYAEFRR